MIAAVAGKLMDRSAVHLDRVRDQYAEATKALMAWAEFPDRILRRVDDDPATRAELAVRGADIKERLGYYTGWVTAESRVMGELYMALVASLRAEVAYHARSAWQQPPRESAAQMNILDAMPAISLTGAPSWVYVQAFSEAMTYRFGWRRHLLWPGQLRRILRRRGLWEPRRVRLPPEDTAF
ncbi:hypothetical protein GCM10010124_02010 [Pilimelia terevasa]|uniref:Uncharacterized protein n=1 Tax=Pilimelia terevasa TaxID=53372 RepID=A0A8J3FDJ3_9ACTN|nr:hypothetical protein GCM10010124_02010 [Pilimelia terevasa]